MTGADGYEGGYEGGHDRGLGDGYDGGYDGDAFDGAEDELRVLLERAVPQPPAPPQRLERVRERVGRRRRRRTAAVTGSAVLAVVALVAVPALIRPHGGGAAPAVVATGGQAGLPGDPSAAASRQPAPAPTPTPTRTPGTPPTTPPAEDGGYSPPGMDGLRLRLPAGWRTLPDADTSSVFVSSQALVLPAGGCRHALDGFCTPLARALGKGGALLMFHVDHNQNQADKLRMVGTAAADEPPYRACRTVGGTHQLGGSLVDRAGSSTIVRITVCLAQASPAQLAQARAVATTADFG